MSALTLLIVLIAILAALAAFCLGYFYRSFTLSRGKMPKVILNDKAAEMLEEGDPLTLSNDGVAQYSIRKN